MKKHNTYFLILVLTGISVFNFTCQSDPESITPDPDDNNDPEEVETIPRIEPPGRGIFHFKGEKLKSLAVISSGNLSDEQKVLVSTLQGLVAKSSSEQIYIDEGGPGSVWKNYLNSKYGITLTGYSSWTALLDHFKDHVNGYVLYDRTANPNSLTAATSLCGVYNAIAVDVSLRDEVNNAGITSLKADVRNRNEKWVYENYADSLTTKMAAELKPSINHHLRDYITLTNAFTFYDGITPWRSNVLQRLDEEAFCFGYYADDEFNMVANASEQGVVMIPSDLAPNLSALSSVYNSEGLKQKSYSDQVEVENVHYVTFLASDGDNVAYNLWSQYNYFNNPARGSFDMGYTINPSLVDLAPSVLSWYYENASSGTHKDLFVAGPSGSGYMFPSRMPVADLDIYLNRLNSFMEKADMNIVNILDQGAFHKMDLWKKYLSMPNIDALFYTGYGESAEGRISFSSNGKPIIEASDNLWEGLEEETTVIENINSRPADPVRVNGYSLVFVHVWTKDLSNIKTVVEGLNANVKVVPPDVFVKLITENVTDADNGSVETIGDGSTYRIINYKSGLSLDVDAISQEDGANVHQWSYNSGENQQWTFADLGGGYYKITAIHSGKILQVAGSSTDEGANVDQSTWNEGDNQRWKAEENEDGTFTLVNKHSGQVLDVENGGLNSGANILQETDVESDSQKWLIQLP